MEQQEHFSSTLGKVGLHNAYLYDKGSMVLTNQLR